MSQRSFDGISRVSMLLLAGWLAIPSTARAAGAGDAEISAIAPSLSPPTTC
jgi:hypothetical protein